MCACRWLAEGHDAGMNPATVGQEPVSQSQYVTTRPESG
jgi:hypothetical protein